MLRQLLSLIEKGEGSVHVNELSRQLGTSPTAVQGMIETLVRTGRLQKDGQASASDCAPINGGCGGCSGPSSCPLPVRVPTAYKPTQQ